jgi:crotonobetainyl-CoA:carnitine CoA-transferase CaiB-like acyl-CoA transferase
VQVRRAPPLLGQHTEEVLAEIGVDAAAARALRERGII